MKGSRVFILMLIAIIMATVQHVNKSNAQGEKIEKLNDGLKEIKEHLPPNANVTFIMPPDGTRTELYIQWIYLLAPRYCSIDPKEKYDTVLAILNTDVSDSTVCSITDNRKLICHSTDGRFNYFLTCNN